MLTVNLQIYFYNYQLGFVLIAVLKIDGLQNPLAAAPFYMN